MAALRRFRFSLPVRVRVEEGTPVRVSYELTEKGAELKPVIHRLRDWARNTSMTELWSTARFTTGHLPRPPPDP